MEVDISCGVGRYVELPRHVTANRLSFGILLRRNPQFAAHNARALSRDHGATGGVLASETFGRRIADPALDRGRTIECSVLHFQVNLQELAVLNSSASAG